MESETQSAQPEVPKVLNLFMSCFQMSPHVDYVAVLPWLRFALCRLKPVHRFLLKVRHEPVHCRFRRCARTDNGRREPQAAGCA